MFKCLTAVYVAFNLIANVQSNESWEDVNMICPAQCICQQAHFMDLSIAKWINTVETKKRKNENGRNNFVDEVHEDSVNNNEVVFEDDVSHLNNDFLKFARCAIPAFTDVKVMIASIPNDVQALVIDTGNLTISLSDFHPLYNLETLEIRGPDESQVKLIFDVPLSQIKHLNIVRVKIEGSEKIKFRPNVESIDPSRDFDYVPNIERYEYSLETEADKNVSLQLVHDEVEILPYEVYKMEIEKWKTISFWGWNNLKILRINNAKLNDLYWEMFDGLEKLEHLSLEGNSIKNIPPFSFYGALNIKSLSLAHNLITELNYRALGGLLELELLDLSDNNLTQLSEMTFPPFPKLEIADLRQNPIKGIYPAAFGTLNNTKVLNIEYRDGKIDENEAQSRFEFLSKLISLDLSNFVVSSLNSMTFQGLKNLKILKVHGSFRTIEYDTFAEMPQLRELNLSDCNIVELSVDTFYGAKQLQKVDLSKNKLKMIFKELFYDLNELQEIYLQQNKLRDLPVEIFFLKSIRLIRVNQNPLECHCGMKKWKQAITNSIPAVKKVDKCSLDDLNCENGEFYESSYVFDHKLAPHCTSSDVLKPKAIYYALRKILKCANKGKRSEFKKLNKEKIWREHEEEMKVKGKEKMAFKEALKPKHKQKFALKTVVSNEIDINI